MIFILLVLFQLLLCSNTLDLGLVFIEMCCEELIAPGEYVCFNRKDELKLLFLQQIPELFHIFTSKFTIFMHF